jgi:hypothetical protein
VVTAAAVLYSSTRRGYEENFSVPEGSSHEYLV